MRTMSDRVHIIAIVKCALNRLAQRIGKKQGGLRLSYSRRAVVILFGILKTPFFYDHSSSLATVVFVGSILRFFDSQHTNRPFSWCRKKQSRRARRKGKGLRKTILLMYWQPFLPFLLVEGTRSKKKLENATRGY